MNDAKVVVFDFDGTICDSFDVVMDVVTGFSTLHPIHHENEIYHDMELKEVLNTLKISPWKVPFLVFAVRRKLKMQANFLHIFPAIENVIKTLQQQKIRVGILTSNSRETVECVMKKNNIELDFLYAGSSLSGKSRLLKKIMHDMKIPSEQLIHVGDETRDIEASKKAGGTMIAVSWGFCSEKLLQKYSPDHIIHHPAELIPLVLNENPDGEIN